MEGFRIWAESHFISVRRAPLASHGYGLPKVALPYLGEEERDVPCPADGSPDGLGRGKANRAAYVEREALIAWNMQGV